MRTEKSDDGNSTRTNIEALHVIKADSGGTRFHAAWLQVPSYPCSIEIAAVLAAYAHGNRGFTADLIGQVLRKSFSKEGR